MGCLYNGSRKRPARSRNIRCTITPEPMGGLLRRMENLPPKTQQIIGLAKLVESLRDTISEPREKGYSWSDTATMLEQECNFEILPNTVRDSYSRSKRKRLAGKNKTDLAEKIYAFTGNPKTRLSRFRIRRSIRLSGVGSGNDRGLIWPASETINMIFLICSPGNRVDQIRLR
jgi:hypothetical protein